MKKNPIRFKENGNRNRTLIGTGSAVFNANSDSPKAITETIDESEPGGTP